MELLTIKDVAERVGLPKPTIYRIFNEMSDLIPHKRLGRKILFPEEAVSKISDIRKLTKQAGYTYRMIRDEVLASSGPAEKVKVDADGSNEAQLAPRLNEVLSRSVAAGFEGLREDLRLLTAQIDRQNDLLSRYLGLEREIDDFSPAMIEKELELAPKAISAMEGDRPAAPARPGIDAVKNGLASPRDRGFRHKWSNFWSGKGWKA